MKSSLKIPMMVLIAGALWISFTPAIVKELTLFQVIEQGAVKAEFKGSGGHLGEVVEARLKNNSKREIIIDIEPGYHLKSEDEGKQDLLLVQNKSITLAPQRSRKIKLQAMCCQASNSSPDSGSAFLSLAPAETQLCSLAGYINDNKLQGNSIAQHAVWVVSDNKPMEDIGGNDKVSKGLQNFVSKLTGKPIPKYKIEYAGEEGGSAHSGVPVNISGEMEYELYSNGPVTFGIYDAHGRAVQMFFTERLSNKGSYTFNYRFKTNGLPAGDYFARMRFDGQVIKEQKFSF